MIIYIDKIILEILIGKDYFEKHLLIILFLEITLMILFLEIITDDIISKNNYW